MKMEQNPQLTESQQKTMNDAKKEAIQQDGGRLKHVFKNLQGTSTEAMDVLRENAGKENNARDTKAKAEAKEKTEAEESLVNSKKAIELINNNQIESLLEHLDNYKFLNTEVASLIINKNFGNRIPEHIKSFKNSSHGEIAYMLIDKAEPHKFQLQELRQHLDDFAVSNIRSLIEKLMKKDGTTWLAPKSLEKIFHEVSHEMWNEGWDTPTGH